MSILLHGLEPLQKNKKSEELAVLVLKDIRAVAKKVQALPIRSCSQQRQPQASQASWPASQQSKPGPRAKKWQEPLRAVSNHGGRQADLKGSLRRGSKLYVSISRSQR